MFLIFGAGGMLGKDMVSLLEREGEQFTALDRSACDITDGNAVAAAFEKYRPTVALNLAAYTNVNGAESDGETAFAVNETGSRNIAEAAERYGARVVYVSTDYVFDGSKDIPYEVDDPVNPLNVYGASKLAGEEAAKKCTEHLIVRTSWVFGAGGNNFVKTMLKLAGEGRELSVVSDQIGAPTYTVDLAKTLLDLVRVNARGIVHATGSGECSWFDFAREIFEITGTFPADLKAVSAEEFPTPAKRPANSRLSMGRLKEFGVEPPSHWHDALIRYLRETGEIF